MNLGYFEQAQLIIGKDQCGEQVWISGSKFAQNQQNVKKANFILILSCIETNFRFKNVNIQHLRFPIEDEDSCDIKAYFMPAFQVIDIARKSGKVLIYCKLGISSSSTILIAYIMQKYNKKWKETLDFVKQKRLCAQPRQAFLKQLEWFQKFQLNRI